MPIEYFGSRQRRRCMQAIRQIDNDRLDLFAVVEVSNEPWTIGAQGKFAFVANEDMAVRVLELALQEQGDLQDWRLEFFQEAECSRDLDATVEEKSKEGASQ